MASTAVLEAEPAASRSKGGLFSMLDSFRATFDDSDAPVWVTRLDGTPVYMNTASVRLLSSAPATADRGTPFGSGGELTRQIAGWPGPAQQPARIAGRTFDALVSPLADHQGESVGAVITLRAAG